MSIGRAHAAHAAGLHSVENRLDLCVVYSEVRIIMKTISKLILCCGIGAAFFSGCTTNPVTGRKELTGLISPEQEVQLGLESFEQMKKQVPIDHDPADNDMVQRVGQRLAAVAGKDLPDAKWEF